MKEHRLSADLVAAGPYSHCVRAGATVWTAGVGPHEPGSGAIPDGVEAQTQATFDNLERALALAGADLSDVVKLTVYLQRLHADKDAFNEVCRRRLSPPFPVRTTVGADLMNILVEIDAVAVVAPADGTEPTQG